MELHETRVNIICMRRPSQGAQAVPGTGIGRKRHDLSRHNDSSNEPDESVQLVWRAETALILVLPSSPCLCGLKYGERARKSNGHKNRINSANCSTCFGVLDLLHGRL